MTFIQVETQVVVNTQEANNYLRQWQLYYKKRKIVNVTLVPADPAGWFLTITYEVEV